jgi:hypothetical protein
VTKGKIQDEPNTTEYPLFPTLLPDKKIKTAVVAELSDTLKRPFAILSGMEKLLANKPEAAFEKQFIAVALKSFEDYRIRATMDAGSGYYRTITPERKAGIIKFYEKTALTMYSGFTNRMARYAESGDTQQQHIADLYLKMQKLQ